MQPLCHSPGRFSRTMVIRQSAGTLVTWSRPSELASRPAGSKAAEHSRTGTPSSTPSAYFVSPGSRSSRPPSLLGGPATRPGGAVGDESRSNRRCPARLTSLARHRWSGRRRIGGDLSQVPGSVRDAVAGAPPAFAYPRPRARRRSPNAALCSGWSGESGKNRGKQSARDAGERVVRLRPAPSMRCREPLYD